MPVRFVPVNPGTDFGQAMSVMNNNFAQLDSEAVTKTFKQAGGNAIVEGKLPYDGGYGSLYYDSSNVPRILIGTDPVNNEMCLVITKSGNSVLDVFS
jgi:hypothetical protein